MDIPPSPRSTPVCHFTWLGVTGEQLIQTTLLSQYHYSNSHTHILSTHALNTILPTPQLTSYPLTPYGCSYSFHLTISYVLTQLDDEYGVANEKWINFMKEKFTEKYDSEKPSIFGYLEAVHTQ
jgi:hypothetical protein